MAMYLAACFTSSAKFFCRGYGAVDEGRWGAQGDRPLPSGWPIQPAQGAVGCWWCSPGPGDAHYLPGSLVWPTGLTMSCIILRGLGWWERTEWAGIYFCQNFKKNQKKWQKTSQLEVESGVFVSSAALEAALAGCSLRERRGEQHTGKSRTQILLKVLPVRLISWASPVSLCVCQKLGIISPCKWRDYTEIAITIYPW